MQAVPHSLLPLLWLSAVPWDLAVLRGHLGATQCHPEPLLGSTWWLRMGLESQAGCPGEPDPEGHSKVLDIL